MQNTAYEMRISDWSSDVCSSDLLSAKAERSMSSLTDSTGFSFGLGVAGRLPSLIPWGAVDFLAPSFPARPPSLGFGFSESPSGNACRSEEHTSELQSLLRISYAVFCLIKKKTPNPTTTATTNNT